MPQDLFLHSKVLVKEAEGLTAVVSSEWMNLSHETIRFPCKMLTFTTITALERVGFMAILTYRLNENRIGVNRVSGFNHEHLFVKVQDVDRALQILTSTARDAQRELDVERAQGFKGRPQ